MRLPTHVIARLHQAEVHLLGSTPPAQSFFNVLSSLVSPEPSTFRLETVHCGRTVAVSGPAKLKSGTGTSRSQTMGTFRRPHPSGLCVFCWRRGHRLLHSVGGSPRCPYTKGRTILRSLHGSGDKLAGRGEWGLEDCSRLHLSDGPFAQAGRHPSAKWRNRHDAGMDLRLG